MGTTAVEVDTDGDGKPNVSAIPVCVVDTVMEQTAASQLSSTNSFPAPGVPFVGTEPFVQILSQDNRRHRAVIIINGAANQGIIIGHQNQMSNGRGAWLTSGQSFVYESAAALYALPQAANGAVIVTVIDERYMPREDNNSYV